jgi:hypothetical protein
MAIPTTYTEAEFKAYLHTAMGAVATSLGWTVAGGSYDEILNDTLAIYGTNDIAAVSSVNASVKLRELGKLAAWRQVVTETATDYNFSADGGKYDRSQVNEMARARVSDLEYSTAQYRAENAVHTQRIDFIHDPYAERDQSEIVL